jgi:hypothetical protein
MFSGIVLAWRAVFSPAARGFLLSPKDGQGELLYNLLLRQ